MSEREDYSLRTGEAAKQVGVTPSTIRNWVKKGYITALVMPSGTRRFSSDEINKLLSDYFQFAPAVESPDD